jgi:hypothetical protein
MHPDIPNIVPDSAAQAVVWVWMLGHLKRYVGAVGKWSGSTLLKDLLRRKREYDIGVHVEAIQRERQLRLERRKTPNKLKRVS